MEQISFKETNEQREAFQSYYKDGVERSYAKTALKFKKSLSTIEKWGRSFNWQVRVEEFDAEVKKKSKEKSIVEQELDYKQRNIRIVKRGILDHAKAIQEGTLKPTYKTLEILMKLEESLRTGIDSTSQVIHKHELRGMSNEEIKKTIDEKVKKILRFKDTKHFKDLEDPIVDAEFKEVKETTNEK